MRRQGAAHTLTPAPRSFLRQERQAPAQLGALAHLLGLVQVPARLEEQAQHLQGHIVDRRLLPQALVAHALRQGKEPVLEEAQPLHPLLPPEQGRPPRPQGPGQAGVAAQGTAHGAHQLRSLCEDVAAELVPLHGQKLRAQAQLAGLPVQDAAQRQDLLHLRGLARGNRRHDLIHRL